MEKVLEFLMGQKAELEEALASGCYSNQFKVLIWKNGLAVGFSKEGPLKPFACGVLHAEVVAIPGMPEEAYAYIPKVLNGHGEEAQLIGQKAAVEAALAQVLGLIAEFSARAAEA